MAYTTDRTWVTGEVVTAAFFNTYLRDNAKWLSTDKPMCRAYNNAAFSHNSSGNYLSVTLNSERFDNATMHDTGSNTDRITCSTVGKYLMGGAAIFSASAGGTGRYIELSLNGATPIAETFGPPVAALNTSLSTANLYATSVNTDYFVMRGWQDSGGSLNILGSGNKSPEVWAFWIGV